MNSRPLHIIGMVLVAALLAVLTGAVLSPYASPAVVRYASLGLAFGAVTFLDQAFLKRRPNALVQGIISGLLTAGLLYVLDLIW